MDERAAYEVVKGGIEFLDGWDILLNMLMMALTGTIIILLSKLKEVMINEYKRKRINTIREISKV